MLDPAWLCEAAADELNVTASFHISCSSVAHVPADVSVLVLTRFSYKCWAFLAAVGEAAAGPN